MTPPTTSTIESTAPTSWKWTSSGVVPWTRGLRLGQPAEERGRALLHLGVEAAASRSAQDLAQPAMRCCVRSWSCACWSCSCAWSCRAVLAVPSSDRPTSTLVGRAGPHRCDLARLEPVAGERQLGQLRAQRVQGQAEVHERAQQHVARRARRAVEVRRCGSQHAPLLQAHEAAGARARGGRAPRCPSACPPTPGAA